MARYATIYEEAKAQGRLWKPFKPRCYVWDMVNLPRLNLGPSLPVVTSITSCCGVQTLSQATSDRKPDYNNGYDAFFDGDDRLLGGSGWNTSNGVVCGMHLNLSSLSVTAVPASIRQGSGIAGTRLQWIVSTAGQIFARFHSGNIGADRWIGRQSNTGVIQTNKDYICLVTYDGSGTSAGVKIRVNGVRVDTADNESLPYVQPTADSTDAMQWAGQADTGNIPTMTSSVLFWCEEQPYDGISAIYEGYIAWSRGRYQKQMVDLLPANNPFKNRPPMLGD